MSCGLLYSLAKQNISALQFIHTAARFEAVQLVLWMLIPIEKISVVLSLWYCLDKYQKAVGVQIDVFEKTSFISGKDQFSTVYSFTWSHGRSDQAYPSRKIKLIKQFLSTIYASMNARHYRSCTGAYCPFVTLHA
jgi:hypothetical protein